MKNDIEHTLQRIQGSFALEGMDLTKQDINDCRAILNGELDADEHIAELVKKHKEMPCAKPIQTYTGLFKNYPLMPTSNPYHWCSTSCTRREQTASRASSQW